MNQVDGKATRFNYFFSSSLSPSSSYSVLHLGNKRTEARHLLETIITWRVSYSQTQTLTLLFFYTQDKADNHHRRHHRRRRRRRRRLESKGDAST